MSCTGRTGFSTLRPQHDERAMNHQSSKRMLGLPSLFAHLSLALAGICLAVSELDFLPEMPWILAVYLVCLALSWYQAGRWTLSEWAANGLAILIAGSAVGWIVYLFQD